MKLCLDCAKFTLFIDIIGIFNIKLSKSNLSGFPTELIFIIFSFVNIV